MPKYLVEKDGWGVTIENNRCVWIEANPTYSKVCTICQGEGTVPAKTCSCKEDNYGYIGWGCDCKTSCTCKMIHGQGMAKDKPKFPMPPQDILIKLEQEIIKTLKVFGLHLNDGIIEKEIKQEKQLNESAEGALL